MCHQKTFVMTYTLMEDFHIALSLFFVGRMKIFVLFPWHVKKVIFSHNSPSMLSFPIA